MWKRGILAILIVLSTGVLLYGEIQAPERVDVGKLLVVSSNDPADVFIWSVPEGLDYVAVDENKRLICTGLEGTYKFQLTTIKMDWENKKFIQSPQQMKVVIIGKANPPQPPQPPDPVVPDLTGTAKEVYTWAGSVAQYRDCAGSLAKNYADIADKYDKMSLTVAQAMDQLRASNNLVLDTREKKDAWAIFGSRLEEKMTAIWPLSKPDLVKFLKDVALGLSNVK